jgi:hypothetical protein
MINFAALFLLVFLKKKNNMQEVPEILRDSNLSAPIPKNGHDSFRGPFIIGFLEEKK